MKGDYFNRKVKKMTILTIPIKIKNQKLLTERGFKNGKNNRMRKAKNKSK